MRDHLITWTDPEGSYHEIWQSEAKAVFFDPRLHGSDYLSLIVLPGDCLLLRHEFYDPSVGEICHNAREVSVDTALALLRRWWIAEEKWPATLRKALLSRIWKRAWARQSLGKEENTLEKRALQLIVSRPDLTVTALAEALGCSRRALYKMPQLCAALKARKQGRKEWPRGHRNKDGTIEAEG